MHACKKKLMLINMAPCILHPDASKYMPKELILVTIPHHVSAYVFLELLVS